MSLEVFFAYKHINYFDHFFRILKLAKITSKVLGKDFLLQNSLIGCQDTRQN